jgi:hypothetical protein
LSRRRAANAGATARKIHDSRRRLPGDLEVEEPMTLEAIFGCLREVRERVERRVLDGGRIYAKPPSIKAKRFALMEFD